jgi:hypothetical protein
MIVTWLCIAAWLATLFHVMPRRQDIRALLLLPDAACTGDKFTLTCVAPQWESPRDVTAIVWSHGGTRPDFLRVAGGAAKLPLEELAPGPNRVELRGLPYGPFSPNSCTAAVVRLSPGERTFLFDTAFITSVDGRQRDARAATMVRLLAQGRVMLCFFEGPHDYAKVQRAFEPVRRRVPLLWNASGPLGPAALEAIVADIGGPEAPVVLITSDLKMANAAAELGLRAHLLVPERCGWVIHPKVRQHTSEDQLAAAAAGDRMPEAEKP